jgi:hypothetical protein
VRLVGQSEFDAVNDIEKFVELLYVPSQEQTRFAVGKGYGYPEGKGVATQFQNANAAYYVHSDRHDS